MKFIMHLEFVSFDMLELILEDWHFFSVVMTISVRIIDMKN